MSSNVKVKEKEKVPSTTEKFWGPVFEQDIKFPKDVAEKYTRIFEEHEISRYQFKKIESRIVFSHIKTQN